MPPGRPPTSIGSPSTAWIEGSTRVTVSPRLLATQTRPWATVTPAGPRPTGIGAPCAQAAEVDAAHGAGRGAAGPEAAGADREPQRRRVRDQAAAVDAAAPGVDRADPGARFVGDPDAAAAEGDRAGLAADVDRCRRPGRLSGSTRRTSPRGGSETQTEPAPTATPEIPAPSRSGLPTGSPLSGSSRVRVPSGSLVTQIASAEAATRSGAAPTGIGAETSTPPPPPSTGDRRATTPAATATAPRRPAHCSRLAAQAGAEAGPAGRDRRGRALRRLREHPGRRQPAALALAGRGDQRARARVAVGGVLGDGPLDHRVEPRRHLRLGVGVLARVGDDPGQRLVEDAAERVDVGGRPDRPAPPLLRRHVLGGADHRGAAGGAALAERLGEAEVGEEGAVAFDQDVVRLDVAVDDAGGVGGVERFARPGRAGRSPGAGGSGPSRSIGLRRSPPSTRRIATISSPSTSRESKTGTTAGWSRLAARRDSRRKRSRKPSRSASSRAITFSATGRSRPRCVAR